MTVIKSKMDVDVHKDDDDVDGGDHIGDDDDDDDKGMHGCNVTVAKPVKETLEHNYYSQTKRFKGEYLVSG